MVLIKAIFWVIVSAISPQMGLEEINNIKESDDSTVQKIIMCSSCYQRPGVTYNVNSGLVV